MTQKAKIKNHIKQNAASKRHMSMRTKNHISNIIIYIILGLMSIVWILPFVLLLFESFEVGRTGQGGNIIPIKWGFDNYINLSKNTDFWIWFKNTLIVSLVASVVQTIMVLSMSYTLSRLRFKGRKFLMNIMLILGMFPGFLTLILLYKVFSDLGMTGPSSVPGLILIYTASSAMGYYVSKGFFDTIPRSLDEAARVDGATRFQVFYKITMPLAKPIVIYTILTAFMGPWGDFMLAKYIAHNSSAGMTVAVGLQNMITKNNISTQYTMFCAAGIIIAIPITILFMCLQKYYVEGVTGGAVKG